jgi:hypothetical protein
MKLLFGALLILTALSSFAQSGRLVKRTVHECTLTMAGKVELVNENESKRYDLVNKDIISSAATLNRAKVELKNSCIAFPNYYLSLRIIGHSQPEIGPETNDLRKENNINVCEKLMASNLLKCEIGSEFIEVE